MGKNKKYSGKISVGLFVEGIHLYVVCLAQKDEKVRLVDAQMLKMANRMEPVSVQEEILTEALSNISDDPISIDLMAEESEAQLDIEDKGSDDVNNQAILRSALQKYPSKKFKVGLSVAEPQVFYAYFGKDWGLEGEKLKKKIIEELSKEKSDVDILTPDALYLANLVDGRLMTILRDSEISILSLFQSLRDQGIKRLPQISFMESAEISLVNLVLDNYSFPETEISVVVYVGHEFSRLIFLQGNKIYNISYIIGAGIDSENITNTIYSRILLEQDNLNLPRIHNIILCGEAYEVELKNYLMGKLPVEIKIDYLRLQKMDVVGIDPLFSRFAVPLGSAWRTLQNSNPDYYDVDLLPVAVREGQKIFKLGILGWVLLFLIPAITFLSTIKISEQKQELTQLQTHRQGLKSELAQLQIIEEKYNTEQQKLAYFDKAFGVLDSMVVGGKTYSTFLNKIANLTQKVGKIWVTDVSSNQPNRAVIKGYSLYRNRIPQFANSIGNATLNKVEVQAIREQTVYSFEIAAELPRQ